VARDRPETAMIPRSPRSYVAPASGAIYDTYNGERTTFGRRPRGRRLRRSSHGASGESGCGKIRLFLGRAVSTWPASGCQSFLRHLFWAVPTTGARPTISLMRLNPPAGVVPDVDKRPMVLVPRGAVSSPPLRQKGRTAYIHTTLRSPATISVLARGCGRGGRHRPSVRLMRSRCWHFPAEDDGRKPVLKTLRDALPVRFRLAAVAHHACSRPGRGRLAAARLPQGGLPMDRWLR